MSASTIYALASGRPPAAIAIVRISGPAAHATGSRLAGELPKAREAAVRTLRASGGEILDEAIVLRFDGPSSATGEDIVELHCHGGRAVVDAVLRELKHAVGLREAAPGEFTRRAFENGRIDLTEAEGLADLLEAETESQRRAALGIVTGGLRRQIEQWQAQVLELSARAEAAIDYVDDGVEVDPALQNDCRRLSDELRRWLLRPRADALKDGLKVVIAGPPNAGKSSLINAIAGTEKAIVTENAGTTRDRIEVPLAIDGVPFLFVDTAGVREADDEVERIGIERALAAINEADVLWWLGNPADAPAHQRRIDVQSKCDLPLLPQEDAIVVSSVSGDGIGHLLTKTKMIAADLLPTEGSTALNRRQAEELSVAAGALDRAAVAGPLFAAEEVRCARAAFDRITGRAGMEDILDQLFGRFCLGK